MKKLSQIVIASLVALVTTVGVYSWNLSNVSQAASMPWLTAWTSGNTKLAPELKSSILSTLEEGQQTFRYDTFGDEEFWGNTLKLHRVMRQLFYRQLSLSLASTCTHGQGGVL